MRSSLLVVVAGVLAVAGCGEASVGSPTDVTPLDTTDEVPPTTSTSSPPDECGEVPKVALASGDISVSMDLVFYEESTDACGYNADGEAMFDDGFRPASALLAAGGELSVFANVVGAFSVDISPLETGLRLASIEPSPDVLSSASDGSYVLSLPGPGCFVVTVGFVDEGRHGRFTGLAESDVDACGIVPSSSECPTDQDRSDTTGNAVVDWIDLVRLGGRSYEHSRTSRLEPSALGNLVGWVCLTLADVVSNPSYRLVDGDAAFLPIGTELRTFEGADPDLRVAALVGGQVKVYEVSRVDGASTGGELIDLTSPITEIRVNPTFDGGPLGTIVDVDVITSLVESLRVAPVAPEFDPGSESSQTYSVELVRADGTATARTFVVETAMMWPGIELPPVWIQAVQHAVAEVTVVGVHDDFSFYGPCGDNAVDVFGTTYYQLFPDEIEALDESRYPLEDGPTGFARVAPPGPGDDIGTLIVYSDGMARYESDSGIVEWLTTEEHSYSWVC